MIRRFDRWLRENPGEFVMVLMGMNILSLSITTLNRFCFHYSRSGGEQDELQGAGFTGGAGA